jgi:uncharacterized membrane protein
MVPILIAIQNTDFFADIRSSGYTYPVLLALHLVFMSLFGGLILITDLRILGIGMKSFSIADVINRTRNFKRVGLVLAATCGLLLFCSKAEGYYYNSLFRTKIILFALVAVHAIIFKRSIYDHPENIEGNPALMGKARVAAAISITLWTFIMIAGRGIGYLTSPPGLHFSSLFNSVTNVL